MKASNALPELKARLSLKDADIEGLTVRDGVEAMLDLYRTERVEEANEDALQTTWNTCDRGIGEQFEFDLTRRFTVPTADSGPAIWQLSLTFSFDASHELRALGSGSGRCPTPAEVDAFGIFIRQSAAYLAVSNRQKGMVLLAFEATT